MRINNPLRILIHGGSAAVQHQALTSPPTTSHAVTRRTHGQEQGWTKEVRCPHIRRTIMAMIVRQRPWKKTAEQAGPVIVASGRRTHQRRPRGRGFLAFQSPYVTILSPWNAKPRSCPTTQRASVAPCGHHAPTKVLHLPDRSACQRILKETLERFEPPSRGGPRSWSAIRCSSVVPQERRRRR